MMEIVRKSSQVIIERLVLLNYPGASKDLMPRFVISEQEEPTWHFKQMFDTECINEVEKSLLNHIWFIGVNSHPQPLFTSDNPVVRQAYNDTPILGGVGTGAYGVEFAYPLTSKYVLILRDRNYFWYNKLRENRVIQLEAQEIDRLNRLQIIQSSRQIFCADDQFGGAVDFCANYPELVSSSRERYDVYINHILTQATPKQIRDQIIVMQRLDKFS